LEEYILELHNIGKTFSGVNVLRDIDLKLKKGEVHALLGENGAGKSTLIKILNGYYQPDKGGEIKIAGKVVQFKQPKDALDASIHTIYQELTLCPLMSVAENIVIDKQDSFHGITLKNKEYRTITLEALERLAQTDIDPNSLVKELSIAKRQVVEIAKALSSNAQILLMDEPTSSISQRDAEMLMTIIKNLSDNGVTIIYISHRLHEIDDIADRITVLRDGDLVGTVNKDDVGEHDLIRMMVGRELTNVYPKTDVDIGETIFRVEGLASEDTFKDVSFEVRKGEIFGIGGLVGAKRTELLETLFGMRPITKGTIYLKGREFVPQSPMNAIKNKMAFITEDRKKNGLVLCLSVAENVNMINAQKKATFGYLNWKELLKIAEDQQKALNIKLNTFEQVVSTLSGGNQQKVVLGKWLKFEPDVILCDEPTRGIDIGAKTEIYAILGELAIKGAAIIMVSSELPELISIADRIMVMREGEMRGIIEKAEASQEKIMTLAALQGSV
jgi:ABC-type sugar transport system ATPase subunit